MNHGEPTLYARYTLFISPGLFAAGLALVLRAGLLRSRGAKSEAQASQRIGLQSMVVSSVLEAAAVAGLWATVPVGVKNAFTQSGALGPLAASAIILGLAALAAAWQSRCRAGIGLPVLAAHLYLGATAWLVVARDLVRLVYLKLYFDAAHAPVVPQWGMFVAFALTLVVGLVFLIVVTKQTVGGIVSANGEASQSVSPTAAVAE